MARIMIRAAGLGACAALLGGLAAGAPAAASAGAAAAARADAKAGPTAAGWRRYRVPVTGQANLIAAAAAGRDDAWAGGFTIHTGSSAGWRELSRLITSGLRAAGRAGGDRPGGRRPAPSRARSPASWTASCCTGTGRPGTGCTCPT